MSTDYKGIDYGLGKTNVDKETNIRYGVINQNEVLQAWSDSSEPYYGEPADYFECPDCGMEPHIQEYVNWGDDLVCSECGEEIEIELPDYAEPTSFYVDNKEYQAECGENGDIFITESPYYTRSQFCSPCAPGAGYLTNPCEDGEKTYCFGHDWFWDADTKKAPYPVYQVEDDKQVN